MGIFIDCSIIYVEIQWDENFGETPVAANHYFVVNGHAKFYGRFIPPSVFEDILYRNGTIKIVADFTMSETAYENAIVNALINENGENDLPSDL
uniref:Uncharacterized protein n=1 Tax=Panagrolaimus sp. ES5 TaxID=591445 RepID=A0AC34GAR4_9BILA